MKKAFCLGDLFEMPNAVSEDAKWLLANWLDFKASLLLFLGGKQRLWQHRFEKWLGLGILGKTQVNTRLASTINQQAL